MNWRRIFHFCEWRAVFRYDLQAQRWFVMDYRKCAVCHRTHQPYDEYLATELYR